MEKEGCIKVDSRKPQTCVGCSLAELGCGFLRPEGTGTNGVFIVGEAAGKHEAKDSLPFRPHAPTGGLLQRMLRMCGFKREDFTIHNAVSCQPPGNDLAPYPSAVGHCEPNLAAAIAKAQPRILLALGGTALKALTGRKDLNISEHRGYVFESVYGVPVIASYHPAFLLRNAMHLLGVSLHDLKRAHQYSKGLPAPLPTSYILTPSCLDVQDYIERLRADATLPVAYDIETATILGENSDRIVQIQFSSGIGEALVLPWEGSWMEAAKQILALPNPKWGWFDRLFDRKILRAQGVTINGETHDLMDVWGHLQPNFMSSKDDAHGDKGVPSKLMSLQSCVSFYYPHEGVWKGMVDPSCPYENGSERDEWFQTKVWPVLRWYGARDADLTHRVGVKLFAALHKGGLYDGYYETKYKLSFVLDDLTARGLPVDKGRQTELREYVAAQEMSLSAELQSLIPEHLLPANRKKGYSGLPKELRIALKEAGLIVPKAKLDYYTTNHYDICNSLGYYVRDINGEFGLVKVLPFNSNSSDQLLTYIRHKGYKVPTHIDTGRDTTGKEAMESLIGQTNDPVLRLVQKIRKLTKLGGTYANGDWVPNGDGRVHGTFRFGTASGQTSCTKPNIQQFPEHYDPNDAWITDLMHRVKGTIRAEKGHVFVKTDLRAFHARMQGFMSEDAAYYRMANFDPHSYVTAYYVGEPDAGTLMSLDDAQLRPRLKEIKTAHAHDRNAKVKRTLFLMQFGGGADKMFRILNGGGFVSVVEVQALMDLIKDLFPRTFRDFPKQTKRLLAVSPRLVSPFGCTRWFWDQDAEQGTAFRVSNPAHCHIQAALVRLHAGGVFREFNAVNFAHDALWSMPRVQDAEECKRVVTAEFEKPSEVLVNSLGAFYVHGDSQIGEDMNSMEDF